MKTDARTPFRHVPPEKKTEFVGLNYRNGVPPLKKLPERRSAAFRLNYSTGLYNIIININTTAIDCLWFVTLRTEPHAPYGVMGAAMLCRRPFH